MGTLGQFWSTECAVNAFFRDSGPLRARMGIVAVLPKLRFLQSRKELKKWRVVHVVKTI